MDACGYSEPRFSAVGGTIIPTGAVADIRKRDSRSGHSRQLEIVDRSVRRLRGEICWDVTYSPITNLSLEFGDPHLEIYEVLAKGAARRKRGLIAERRVAAKGRWWLWIYLAFWAMETEGQRVTGSSSVRRIRRACQSLLGQKLVQWDVDASTGASRLTFDLNGVLTVRRTSAKSQGELWILHEPEGYALSVRGDGTYDHEPASGIDRRSRVTKRRMEEAVARAEQRGQQNKG